MPSIYHKQLFEEHCQNPFWKKTEDLQNSYTQDYINFFCHNIHFEQEDYKNKFLRNGLLLFPIILGQ